MRGVFSFSGELVQSVAFTAESSLAHDRAPLEQDAPGRVGIRQRGIAHCTARDCADPCYVGQAKEIVKLPSLIDKLPRIVQAVRGGVNEDRYGSGVCSGHGC